MRFMGLAQELFQSCVHRGEAAIVSDLKYRSARLCLLKHQLRIADGCCERFLAENVLTGFDCGNGKGHVLSVWCRDVDGIAGIEELFGCLTNVSGVRSRQFLSIRRYQVVNASQFNTLVVS